MKAIVTLLFVTVSLLAQAQVPTIIDRRHLQIVNENAAVRNSSELKYQQSLAVIGKNTEEIAANVAGRTMAETIKLRSLTSVNELIKDSQQVKQIFATASAIHQQLSQLAAVSQDDPALLAFVEQYIGEAGEQATALAHQVSTFIIREGDNVLINQNVRDDLLTNTLERMQEIRTELSAVYQSMYWTKVNGKLKSLNPYQQYVEQDLALMDRILLGRQTLKR